MAGSSHGTRTAVSLGSQMRRAMLSARKTSTAATGGQRDSPSSVAVDASPTGESPARAVLPSDRTSAWELSQRIWAHAAMQLC